MKLCATCGTELEGRPPRCVDDGRHRRSVVVPASLVGALATLYTDDYGHGVRASRIVHEVTVRGYDAFPAAEIDYPRELGSRVVVAQLDHSSEDRGPLGDTGRRA